jgi:ABC-2 type transport system permease protein
MHQWRNIAWLGIKEIRSVLSDFMLVVLIIYSFSLAIYAESTAKSEAVNNASVGIIDEDHSALSRAIVNALYPPYFKPPIMLEANAVDQAMFDDKYMFVISIPPKFEASIRQGRQPTIQIDIDATAVAQASLGNNYIQNIINQEVSYFAARKNMIYAAPVNLVLHTAYNPNGVGMWFNSINAIVNQLTMLTIILTGAALIREREHGTIEHLLVMPLNTFQIVMAKISANSLIILTAFVLSLFLTIDNALHVPILGSKGLLIAGTILYLFSVASIGIFLGTIAQSMAQFALLVLMLIIPMMMLSGGMSPIENQPDLIQPVTWLLPSRHYMAFAQAVVFRGAELELVWQEMVIIAGLGLVFFSSSVALFRRSLTLND